MHGLESVVVSSGFTLLLRTLLTVYYWLKECCSSKRTVASAEHLMDVFLLEHLLGFPEDAERERERVHEYSPAVTITTGSI